MDDIYSRLRSENKDKYGTRIGVIAQFIIASLYSSRTHFLFELLQNTEDACDRAKRQGRLGPFYARFELFEDKLVLRHNGIPFEEDDVRGICGLVEGTKEKDPGQIGKFGIGFKSVYAFTTSPEIYSAGWSFKIENYVYPIELPKMQLDENETVIIIPFNSSKVPPNEAYQGISKKLSQLGLRTLLFLKQIKTIDWVDERRRSREQPNRNAPGDLPQYDGRYLKTTGDERDPVRVSLSYSERRVKEIRESWLVFEENSPPEKDKDIQVAYKLEPETKTNREVIKPIEGAKLFSFFETEKETHLRFLIHGRYITIPSRENIVEDDPTNRDIINRTSILVSDSISKIKAKKMLDVNFLNVLPINTVTFAVNQTPFRPIYGKVLEKLKSEEALLPTDSGGYTSSSRALLGRGRDLRNLLSGEQLAMLFRISTADWLDDGISFDKTKELREYLIGPLGIKEIDPERFARSINRDFLEKQSDDWIIQFYNFLLDQEALWKKGRWKFETDGTIRGKPIVRLESGRHVVPFREDGSPQAYFPSKAQGGDLFPTAKKTIIQDANAKRFLQLLGLAEPDYIDAVIHFILPKYGQGVVPVSDEENLRDIQFIGAAMSTLRSGDPRNYSLLYGLKSTPILAARNMQTSKVSYKEPKKIHLGQDYGNPWADAYFEGDPETWVLDPRYKTHISLEAIKQLGCLPVITVEYIQPEQDGHVLLADVGRRHRRGLDGFDPDFAIERIEYVLGRMNLERSKILWKILKKYHSSIQGTVEESTNMRFSPSSRETHFSRTGGLLIGHEWLPDPHGTFRKPADLRLSDLPDGFEKESDDAELLAFSLEMKEDESGGFEAQLPADHREILELLPSASPETIVRIKMLLRAESNGSSPESEDLFASSTEETEEDFPEKDLVPFADRLFERQAHGPSIAPLEPVRIPSAGPNTQASAVADTVKSRKEGRAGDEVSLTVKRWLPRPVSKALEEQFRDMVEGDYEKRCQVCGDTFQQKNGDLQAYLVHLLQPTSHELTNHFGNLVSLCGWHYALTSYGQWDFVDPTTKNRVENVEQLRAMVLGAEMKLDERGNNYYGVPVRFYNIYRDWEEEPTPVVDGELRYSEPHWKYLCQLVVQGTGADGVSD